MSEEKSGSGANTNAKHNGIVSAVAFLKQKYPGQFNQTKNEASKASSRKFFVVSSVIAVILTSAWLRWGQFSFVTNYDFIYNSGLTGGILMLVALTYSLRKRLPIFKNSGRVESWYFVHLCAGIAGPLITIVHSSFAIKSVNSLIAIVAMALIVCSGVLGRFLFTRLSFIMHSKLERIDREEVELFDTLVKYDSEVIRKHLSRLTLTCMTQPRTVFHIPYAYFLVRAQAAACYVVIGDQITKVLVEVAKRSSWDDEMLCMTVMSEKHYLKQYINTLMDVSLVRSCEQLLSKWRFFHAPLMYLLLLCSLAHVWAVHAYS